jgi:predicted AAA+ superfamily ATPase
MGKPVVKVITGLRRAGKSCFLKQIMEWLKISRGVPASRILFVDKESLEFEKVAAAKDLYALAAGHRRHASRGKIYLFVDEIQEISDWEKAVAALAARSDMDIIITGSNAHLFSSELATRLSGRYIEFPVYTLDFAEFLQFRGKDARAADVEFRNYLRFGGFPALHHFDLNEEVVYQYINAVYNTVLLKDIVRRHQIRQVSLLENIGRFAFDNIGNLFSANRVSDYLRSQRLKIGVDTVQNYLRCFLDAQILYKASRFDVKGKRHLEIGEKYYLGEIGLRHAILGYREGDISALLENLVFLALKKRGYRVSVGKTGDREVDFVAERERELIYVQVAYLLADSRVVGREIAPLLAIDDNYPKFILSMDRNFGEDIKGIHRVNLIDFLLDPDKY